MSALPRRAARFLIRLILVVVFVAIPGGVAYLGLAGLPKHFTRQIAKTMSGAEYEVRIERIHLNLLRGLVAMGIEVTDRARTPLLEIDRLAVALNLTDLLERRVRVESLELRRANLRVPVGEGKKVSVGEVSARIFLPPGQLHILRATGILEGIHWELEGVLLHPLAFDPSMLAGGDERTTADSATQILEILREMEHKEGPPTVRFQVGGDLGDMRSIVVDSAEARFGKTTWREVHILELQARGGYRDGIFTLEDFLLRSEGATLHAAGTYSDRSGASELLLRGNVHPLPWLRSLGMEEQAAEWDFPVPPKVDLHASNPGASPPGQAWHVLGSVALEAFRYRTVPVDFLGADFAWQPGTFLTREARVRAPAVDATLDVRLRDGTVSARASGTFNPALALPWLGEGTRRGVAEMIFADPAIASIELEIPIADTGAMTGSGVLELGRTAMRGAWIDGGRADLILADRALEFRNIDLRIDGGRGSGVFVYDFGRREVRLHDIVSTVPPGKVLLWIDPEIASVLAPYRWRVPPLVHCEGTVNMSDPGKTRLDIRLEAPQGMEYGLLGQDLYFSDVAGAAEIRGRELQMNIPRARLFGGDVTLQTTVSLDHRDPVYRLETTLRDVDFAAVTRLYFNYTGSDGKLNADFSYTAEFARQTELVGSGWIRVEKGNVFAIPMLGPLSVLLGSIIPGAGYQTARLATADFTVANEIIRSDNLEIVGTGFSLYGEGGIHFVADNLDMTVRLNAQGAPGLVLFPVSKLFEYEGVGPLGNPRWRPRNIPQEFTGEGLIEAVANPVRQLLGGEGGIFAPGDGGEGDTSPTTAPTRPRKKPR